MTGPIRRERKKATTREGLMNAAMSLFAEYGVLGTRVQDITEKVDLGKGAFYNYFGSKAELIAALVSRGNGLLEEHYLSQLNGERDLAARVRELTWLLHRFFEDNPEYVVLFHQARGLLQLRPTKTEGLQRAFSDYLKLLGDALPPSAERVCWSAEDLIDVASAVAGELAGYRTFCFAAGGEPDPETMADALALGVPALLEQRRLQD